MKESREDFLEELKYEQKENVIVDESFFKNIKNYLILKNSIDNSNINVERKYIEDVLEYFSFNKLNTNNIVYWDRSKIDQNGKIYIDGILVDENLYPQICDIFILNQSIIKVFEEECKIGNFSDLEIEFSNNINSSGMCDYKQPNEAGISKISIYEGKLYKDLASDDKNIRLEACENAFIALFHEIQHYRQYMLTQSMVSNKNALLYAKEFVAKKILEDKFYSPKYEESNYYELATENNAYYVGADKYLKIVDQNKEDLLEEKEFYNAYFSESKLSVDVLTKDGQKQFKYEDLQEKDDALTKILDETITPEYIEKYPILQKEYNKDGSKKDTNQLVNNFHEELKSISNLELGNEEKEILIKDTNEMYYELIYKEISKNSNNIENILKDLDYSKFLSIINNMSNYFLKEKERRIANCKTLCQEKYLDDENPEEVFAQDIDYINNYYNNKLEYLLQIRENSDKNIQTEK